MLTTLKTKLRALLRKSEMERELDEELRRHIEQQTEQNIRLGMNPEEARHVALNAFGGVEQAKERSRDARGVRWIEELWQDLRYGVRMLVKAPNYTLIAVITLALGIGANTAIFSVVNGVLLRPLPYNEPERLARVYSEFPTMSLRKFWISAPEYLDIQKEAKSWESIGAWSTGGVNVSTTSEPMRVTSARITRSLI